MNEDDMMIVNENEMKILFMYCWNTCDSCTVLLLVSVSTFYDESLA